MSGLRASSWRGGDQSEYLALYILSALGLVTQVPRQEDIGFDFVCSVADQEEGNLTFRFPYLVTAKSIGDPEVGFFPAKAWNSKVPVHVDWIFSQDSPLYLAVVDKQRGRLLLYSCTLAYYSIYGIANKLGALSLVPRLEKGERAELNAIEKRGELEDFPGKGHYAIDLGDAMLDLSVDTIRDKRKLALFKRILREDIVKQRAALQFLKMGVPFFEPQLHETNVGAIKKRYFYHGKLTKNSKTFAMLLKKSAPVLWTMALYYKDHGPIELTEAACKLLLSSYDEIPDPIKVALEDYL
jgi:hypothetical protein